MQSFNSIFHRISSICHLSTISQVSGTITPFHGVFFVHILHRLWSLEPKALFHKHCISTCLQREDLTFECTNCFQELSSSFCVVSHVPPLHIPPANSLLTQLPTSLPALNFPTLDHSPLDRSTPTHKSSSVAGVLSHSGKKEIGRKWIYRISPRVTEESLLIRVLKSFE